MCIRDSRYQLKTHLLKSHNEGTWFTCHICQKKFSHSGNFKRHLFRHEGVKPYVCNECSMSFCTEGELRQHQFKQSDYKQFCCGSCGKYFKQKHDVVSHFNRCSVKLGYVHIFARQDWDREQTMCGQLLVGQSCYCWLKTCQWDSHPGSGSLFLSIGRSLSNELLATDTALIWFYSCVYVFCTIFS